MIRGALISLVLLAIALLSGCASAHAGYSVREQDALHRAAHPGWLLTEGGTIYVPPPLADYWPTPKDRDHEAVMLHEEVHADRQLAWAVPLAWGAWYRLDRAFRWDEERRGYEAQIRSLGVNAPPKAVWLGIVLDSAYGGMVSRADAEEWLASLGIK